MRFAKRLHAAIHSGTSHKLKSDAYTELLSEFLADGIPIQMAHEMTWDIFGLYGSQGAFLEYFANEFEPFEGLGEALSYISHALSLIDALPGHKNYSLPQAVKTGCTIGKPYHFWMAAYLAYRSHQKHHFVKSSAYGAHQVGVFFELFSRSNGRSVAEQEKSSEQKMLITSLKLNLVWNAAGAVYGATFKQNKTAVALDMDTVFGTAMASRKHRKLLYVKDEIPMSFYYNLAASYYNNTQIIEAEEIFDNAWNQFTSSQ